MSAVQLSESSPAGLVLVGLKENLPLSLLVDVCAEAAAPKAAPDFPAAEIKQA